MEERERTEGEDRGRASGQRERTEGEPEAEGEGGCGNTK